jgi:hypothetical protein
MTEARDYGIFMLDTKFSKEITEYPGHIFAVVVTKPILIADRQPDTDMSFDLCCIIYCSYLWAYGIKIYLQVIHNTTEPDIPVKSIPGNGIVTDPYPVGALRTVCRLFDTVLQFQNIDASMEGIYEYIAAFINYDVFRDAEFRAGIVVELPLLRRGRDEVCDFFRTIRILDIVNAQTAVEIAAIDPVRVVFKEREIVRLVDIMRA